MIAMTSKPTSTDRIEKRVELRAPRSRVWDAIADSQKFATWFGIRLDGPFAEGSTVKGFVTSKGYEHFKIVFQVQKIEAERYFAYRWHPYPSDPTVDYSKEPTTLVEFTLDEAEDGCVLTIVESGFDQIPIARRAEAFRNNDGGWTGQVKNITKYVA